MKEQLESDKSLKILQLPSWYLPESGRFCRDQACFLKKSGIDIDVIANVPLPWRKHKLKVFKYPRKPFFSEEDGLTVYRNYFIRIPQNKKLNDKRWINRTLQLFEQYIKIKGKPDIIHVHVSLWAGYVAFLIKQKYNIPYVLTEHSSVFRPSSNIAPCIESYLTKILSNADYILPVGSLIIPKIKEYIRHKEKSIQIISNIIDPLSFYYKERATRETFTFIAVNSFRQIKAYDILLPAFDIVYEQNPNIRLVIAGKDFETKEFQKLAQKCKHTNQIEFCGFLSSLEVRDRLWESDALVLPSRSESQSISILEALSTGLPVVCTEGVPPEVVSNQQGYRVPVENIQALADAMLKMAETANQFDPKAISRHAHAMADGKVFLEETERIYQQIKSKY